MNYIDVGDEVRVGIEHIDQDLVGACIDYAVGEVVREIFEEGEGQGTVCDCWRYFIADRVEEAELQGPVVGQVLRAEGYLDI